MNKRQEIMLNSVNRLQSQSDILLNALGYKVDITTMTAISTKVINQRFYEVAPSDFMAVIEGQNAFAEEILTYKEYQVSGNIEDGILKGNSNVPRMTKDDIAMEAVRIPIIDWGQGLQYNLIELSKATRSGNWSLVDMKEKARLKKYQLLIQNIAFLGSEQISDVKGLLTQSDVSSNTTTITKFIKNMSTAEFFTFISKILADYSSNSNSTAMPDTFIMPMSDWLGLGVPLSETYPNTTKLEWLKKTFIDLTGNANFKIGYLAYCDKARNSHVLGSGTGYNRYILYKNDADTLNMNIPLPYTTTITDTINGFEYQSVAYSQFSGCKAYRPQEVLYFDHQL